MTRPTARLVRVWSSWGDATALNGEFEELMGGRSGIENSRFARVPTQKSWFNHRKDPSTPDERQTPHGYWQQSYLLGNMS